MPDCVFFCTAKVVLYLTYDKCFEQAVENRVDKYVIAELYLWKTS